ncbi:MAG: hypothetical protein M3331_03060 [Actinomycetota bacterium]|nr:hypothetical protein [Actinomycetota bacterium]
MASEGSGSGEMPRRIIDVPIESLPFVDEHYIEIAAKPDEVWDALMRVVSDMRDGRSGPPVAKALGCEEIEARGEAGEIGSKIPGFVVTRSVRPAVLALMGQHRFSRYALIFTILEKPSGLMLLSAQTRAEFPGRKGRLYRGLVIGSHGHVVVTTSLLRQVRRRAERIHARPARA